jgi:hypothetical protein
MIINKGSAVLELIFDDQASGQDIDAKLDR